MNEAVADKPKGSRIKKIALWVFGIFILLAVIGAIAGPENKQAKQVADTSTDTVVTGSAAETTPALPVTAMELSRAYEANEVAAQRKYGEKTLEISGTVAGVELDFMDNPVVKLAASNQFMPVQVSFDKSYGDKVSQLSKGAAFTARCEKVAEAMSMPLLSECSF